jgi:hypothetical protein
MSIRKSNKLHKNPKRFISTCNNNLTATATAAALADIGGTFQSFVDKENYQQQQRYHQRRIDKMSKINFGQHIKIVNLLLRLNRILWLIIADKEEVVVIMVDLEPLEVATILERYFFK